VKNDLGHYLVPAVALSFSSEEILNLNQRALMKLFLLFTLLAGSGYFFAGGMDSEEEWKPLFNGKDLTGWTPKVRHHPAGDNYGRTFRVVDGNLSVRYEDKAYPAFDNTFGHLFYKEKFSYYRLRLQYRFIGNQANEGPGWAFRNSGIMVHGQSPESMGLHQDFPVSVEVQLLGGNGKDPRTTMNLCTPGTHVVKDGKLLTQHCISSSSDTYHGDQWVDAEVLVLGDSLIRHYVNGKEVLAYSKPQVGGGNVDDHDAPWGTNGDPLTEGTISLQSESHPVEFRKIEILNLQGCMDPKAVNYKSYYIKSNPSDCRYN
jgi:hypothetical protein